MNPTTIYSIIAAIALVGCGSSSKSTKTETPPSSLSEQIPPTEVEPSPLPVPVPAPAPGTTAAPVAAPVQMSLMQIEMAAYEAAKPVFEEECGMCHTPPKSGKKGGKSLSHFSMAGYPFDGHHKTELGQSIRTSLGASGKVATMPKNDPGSLTGDRLNLVLTWADAFDAAKAAGVGYHTQSAETSQKDSPKHAHGKKHGHQKKHKHDKKHSHQPKGKHEHKKKHQH